MSLKAYSHGAIATATYLMQQMNCMEFNVSVHMVRLQQRYQAPYTPLKKSLSRSQSWTGLKKWVVHTLQNKHCSVRKNPKISLKMLHNPKKGLTCNIRHHVSTLSIVHYRKGFSGQSGLRGRKKEKEIE